ncbi:pre-mRNA-splicing factor Sad1p [[Candida] anglica]|uniref:Pre-mRNA-splicing factor Sad1p n=1 Tax=[Candida] anglica TaxID=148631 RepID=A0ABP0EE80_9ASCO
MNGKHGLEDDSNEETKKPRVEASDGIVVESSNRHYLETINKELLNFDYEKVCSVSLSNVNVYCCLVCGKYFQGRSRTSHAYLHAVNMDHHVFINMETLKCYILPENKELTGRAKVFDEIRSLINPQYTMEDIALLQVSDDFNYNTKDIPPLQVSYDLHHKVYHPGYVGLNNISCNTYANVILQLLSHIPPIRDYFLSLSTTLKQDERELLDSKSELNAKFGLLVRKIWSKNLYRNHISPHELMQLVKSKFSLGSQPNPKHFLVWLLNQLHMTLAKALGTKQTVFSKSFQGKIRIKATPVNKQTETTTTIRKFWMITLDLSDSSPFQKTLESNDENPINDHITQVSFKSLLSKYDGETITQATESELNTFQIVGPAPPYLIFHIDRKEDIKSNSKAPKVLKFESPMDMSPYVLGGNTSPHVYDLVGHVKHESIPGVELDRSDDKHDWTVSVRRNRNDWVSIHDLDIEPCNGDLLFLEESYLLVWRKRD